VTTLPKLDETHFSNFIGPLLNAVQKEGGELYITGSVDEALQVLNRNMSEEEKDHYLETTPFPGDFDISIVFSEEKIKKVLSAENSPLRQCMADQYAIINRKISDSELEKGFVILRPQFKKENALPFFYRHQITRRPQ